MMILSRAFSHCLTCLGLLRLHLRMCCDSWAKHWSTFKTSSIRQGALEGSQQSPSSLCIILQL
ncbi:hypothetical protein M758_2G138200 [Ceratodon purpureus]|nr:hypothetical protein M758_2G138200 [Ceratodon purpureus]